MANAKLFDFPSMFCTAKGQSLNSSYYHYLKGWAHCLDDKPIGELSFKASDLDYTDWIVVIFSDKPDQVFNDAFPRPHSHTHWRSVTITRGSFVRTNCMATLDVKEESDSIIFVYLDVYSHEGQQVYFFKGPLPGTIAAYNEYCVAKYVQTDK